LKITIIVGIIFITFFAVRKWQSNASTDEKITNDIITVETIRERLKTEKLIMVDVRTPEEYDGKLGHINGTILIPLNELPQRLNELEDYKSEEIIMVCRSGNRSGKATKLLINNGFNARNMVGGMIQWNRTQ
jgi:rhodanese-related sulfurtransferase